MADTEHPAVTNFREYLRIKTVHPNPDYDGAMVFLKRMADDIGLPYKIVEILPGIPILLMTWEGTNPTLTSLLLNSHTDVVPVFQEHWKVDAFGAEKMENGDIYARGTQDMKSVGIQYLEAIRRLKSKGHRCLRTVHLSFMPEEETAGPGGMLGFVKHEDLRKLNVGFALDEGLANPTRKLTVFYGERSSLGFRIRCPGQPGHGSRFIQNTAAEKLHKIITRFLELRTKEEKRYHGNCLKLGDVTTVNLTKLEGGVQINVVPDEFIAYFDVRMSPRDDVSQMDEQVQAWCREAGEGVTYEYIYKGESRQMTSTDKSDPWWNAFSTPLEKMGYEYDTEIFSAATDSQQLREIGLPAIGFSPINNTPILLHDHNEFLNENVFLKGIEVYEAVILSLANVSKF